MPSPRVFRNALSHMNEERPRLKGLEEMPVPRRTLRQHYFRAKANIKRVLASKLVTGLSRLIMLMAIVWMVARSMGIPVEDRFMSWLAEIRGRG